MRQRRFVSFHKDLQKTCPSCTSPLVLFKDKFGDFVGAGTGASGHLSPSTPTSDVQQSSPPGPQSSSRTWEDTASHSGWYCNQCGLHLVPDHKPPNGEVRAPVRGRRGTAPRPSRSMEDLKTPLRIDTGKGSSPSSSNSQGRVLDEEYDQFEGEARDRFLGLLSHVREHLADKERSLQEYQVDLCQRERTIQSNEEHLEQRAIKLRHHEQIYQEKVDRLNLYKGTMLSQLEARKQQLSRQEVVFRHQRGRLPDTAADQPDFGPPPYDHAVQRSRINSAARLSSQSPPRTRRSVSSNGHPPPHPNTYNGVTHGHPPTNKRYSARHPQQHQGHQSRRSVGDEANRTSQHPDYQHQYRRNSSHHDYQHQYSRDSSHHQYSPAAPPHHPQQQYPQQQQQHHQGYQQPYYHKVPQHTHNRHSNVQYTNLPPQPKHEHQGSRQDERPPTPNMDTYPGDQLSNGILPSQDNTHGISTNYQTQDVNNQNHPDSGLGSISTRYTQTNGDSERGLSEQGNPWPPTDANSHSYPQKNEISSTQNGLQNDYNERWERERSKGRRSELDTVTGLQNGQQNEYNERWERERSKGRRSELNTDISSSQNGQHNAYNEHLERERSRGRRSELNTDINYQNGPQNDYNEHWERERSKGRRSELTLGVTKYEADDDAPMPLRSVSSSDTLLEPHNSVGSESSIPVNGPERGWSRPIRGPRRVTEI